MKTIKERLNKNITELRLNGEKEKEIKEKKQKLEIEFSSLWDEIKENTKNGVKNNNEEVKARIEEINKKIKEEETNKKVNDFKFYILKNNLDLLFYEIINDEIFDILHKYDDKRIGEKTKEKIYNEVNDYMKANYNIELHFYFYREFDFSKDYKLTFDFRSADNYYEKYSEVKLYKNIEEKKIFSYNNYNYNYIENVEETAEEIYKEKETKEKELKELNARIEEIKEEYKLAYMFNNTNNDSFKLYY